MYSYSDMNVPHVLQNALSKKKFGEILAFILCKTVQHPSLLFCGDLWDGRFPPSPHTLLRGKRTRTLCSKTFGENLDSRLALFVCSLCPDCDFWGGGLLAPRRTAQNWISTTVAILGPSASPQTKKSHAAQGIWLLFEAHIKGKKTTEEAERGREKGGKLFRLNKVTVP